MKRGISPIHGSAGASPSRVGRIRSCRRVCTGLLLVAGIFSLVLAGPALGAEPKAPAGKTAEAPAASAVNGNGINPLSHYDEVITKNPFSPRRYRKPAPPAPKPKPKPAPPRKKVVSKVKNLTLTGVCFDNGSRAYQALIEVLDGPSLFLSAGKSYKKIKILGVRIDAVDITNAEGKKQTLRLGDSLHDGVTLKTTWVGGPQPRGGGPAKASSPSKASPPGKSSMSDEAKRKLIERMKARRRKRKK